MKNEDEIRMKKPITSIVKYQAVNEHIETHADTCPHKLTFVEGICGHVE